MKETMMEENPYRAMGEEIAKLEAEGKLPEGFDLEAACNSTPPNGRPRPPRNRPWRSCARRPWIGRSSPGPSAATSCSAPRRTTPP